MPAPSIRKSDGKTELLVPVGFGDARRRSCKNSSGERPAPRGFSMIRQADLRLPALVAHDASLFVAWSRRGGSSAFTDDPGGRRSEEARLLQGSSPSDPRRDRPRGRRPRVAARTAGSRSSTRRGEIYLVDNPWPTTPQAGEVHPVRARPARGARPGLPRRLALRHPARRGVADQGHRRRRQGRPCSRPSPTPGRSTATTTNTPSARSSTGTGNIWVALCLTGSFTSENKFRGWACGSAPDGKVDPDLQRPPLARRASA